MSTFVRRALAAAALCASAASASAMQWQLQSFSYGMANEPATGTFFYDGVSFSDWNIRTPFSVDYVGFEYTTANSRIDMVGDGFIILGLNYSADKCQLRNDAPPTGATTWCMQISLPGVFDGSSVSGSFNEYRTTYGGYAEGRAYGGTYAPIPEPATAAMLLAGAGLVGWTARRRRRA